MPAARTPSAPSRQSLTGVHGALIGAVATLAATVATLAYIVSFEAISAYTVRIGALPAGLRWCGPLLVDTFITIATLFLLWLSLTATHLARQWDAWYAWTLVTIATAASAYLNAAHAPHRLDARLVAGAVPVALLASVHLLLRLVVRVLAWTTAATAATRPAAPVNHSTVAGRGAPSPRANRQNGTRRRLADTRAVYDRLAATGQSVTWHQFAQAFTPAMPKRTAQRHLAHHTRSATGTATPTATGGHRPPEETP
jgi:hypothetical protein